MRKFKAVYAKQYADPQNQGQMKTSWKQLGFANEIEKDGKVTIHLTLDAIPTGVWDGEVKLFLQDEQQGGNNQPQQQQSYQQPSQQQQAQSYAPTIYQDANGIKHDGKGNQVNDQGVIIGQYQTQQQ